MIQYECDYCGEKINQKKGLNEFIMPRFRKYKNTRIPTKEETHLCDVCFIKFANMFRYIESNE